MAGKFVPEQFFLQSEVCLDCLGICLFALWK